MLNNHKLIKNSNKDFFPIIRNQAKSQSKNPQNHNKEHNYVNKEYITTKLKKRIYNHNKIKKNVTLFRVDQVDIF